MRRLSVKQTPEATALKTKEAARQLGISYWHLISLLRSEKLQAPPKDSSGDFVWTEQDLDAARRALEVGRRSTSFGRWRRLIPLRNRKRD